MSLTNVCVYGEGKKPFFKKNPNVPFVINIFLCGKAILLKIVILMVEINFIENILH